MKITFDGSNGEEIAAALSEARSASARAGMSVAVNAEYSGPGLSLSRVWTPEKGAVDATGRPIESQEWPDSWRIPVGFSLDTTTGEVMDREGRVWNHEDLVEL